MAPEEPPTPAPEAQSAYKSRGGLQRVWHAATYSLAGLRAAVRHEAAFRQELALGVPLLLAVPWLAPGRWQALLMAGSIVAVWVVELLNSAVEALADTVSLERHPMLGRAKDLGSAAVMLSLAFAVSVWLVVLWPA
jgi:diacylglycerol kinase (ATP)